MRPLTDDETSTVLEKLKKFFGDNLPLLFSNSSLLLRLHKDRVFLLSEEIIKKSNHIPRKSLVSAGTLIGKFTHSKRFRVLITALGNTQFSSLAKHKVWLKPGGAEQSFLYGNHIVKAHLQKITEEAQANSGVMIFSSTDYALGFGAMAKEVGMLKSTSGPESIAVYHQSDSGEYLRSEHEIV